MAKKSVDVLVIGAGPVGLFCANELARHGLRCRIFDKKSGLSDKSKALGLRLFPDFFYWSLNCQQNICAST